MGRKITMTKEELIYSKALEDWDCDCDNCTRMKPLYLARNVMPKVALYGLNHSCQNKERKAEEKKRVNKMRENKPSNKTITKVKIPKNKKK